MDPRMLILVDTTTVSKKISPQIKKFQEADNILRYQRSVDFDKSMTIILQLLYSL